MKKIFLAFSLFFCTNIFGQALLGFTENNIRNKFPEKRWKSDYTKYGQKYITADFSYGSVVYYFNNETKLCSYVIQIPDDLVALNALVEIYNKKYVITSNKSWTAYLDEGGIMYIKLKYEPDYKLNIFSYSDTENN